MRRTLTTAATAVLLAGLAACSSNASSSNDPTPRSSVAAGATAEESAPPAKKLTTAAARTQAAKILKKEDADFRAFLSEGEGAVGTSQFTAWYQKAIAGLDMNQRAFSNATSLFTASNEPTDLLEAWRSANGDANAAITQFAMDGTGPDAPNEKTQKDAADARAALDEADKKTEEIANGG